MTGRAGGAMALPIFHNVNAIHNVLYQGLTPVVNPG